MSVEFKDRKITLNYVIKEGPMSGWIIVDIESQLPMSTMLTARMIKRDPYLPPNSAFGERGAGWAQISVYLTPEELMDNSRPVYKHLIDKATVMLQPQIVPAVVE